MSSHPRRGNALPRAWRGARLALLMLPLCGMLMLPLSATHAAIRIIIVNADGPDEGFNDPTPVTPAGGNPAATLGQARLNAVQYAADQVGLLLDSPYPVRVRANFNALGGDPDDAVLAQATPQSFYREFQGANGNVVRTGTWYPSALADLLSDRELNPGNADVTIRFNKDIDGPVALGDSVWYYGLDRMAGANDVDLVTVAMHELIHGLGFISLVDTETGEKFLGFDDIFMVNLENHATEVSFPDMAANTLRLAAMANTGNLHWLGNNVNMQMLQLLTAGHDNGHVQMYAPNPIEPGSSVSHFSDALTPNNLMEPGYTAPDHDARLALYLLQDLGWGTPNIDAGTADLSVAVAASTANVVAGEELTYTVTTTNAGPNIALSGSLTNFLPPHIEIVSASPEQGSCDHANGVVSCALGDIDPQASVVTTITAAPLCAGSNANAAAVSSGTTDDSDTANNRSQVMTTVTQGNADLEIAAISAPATAALDGDFELSATIQNNGPGTAGEVVLSGALPAGIGFVSAGPGCNHADGTVTCRFARIASGATAIAAVTLEALAVQTSNLFVSVSSCTSDAVAANNTASAAITATGDASGDDVGVVGGGGGGGCTLHSSARLDLTLPALLLLALLWLWRRRDEVVAPPTIER